MVFFHPHSAKQPDLFHEALHGFVVQRKALLTQLCRDAPVSITAFVFMVDHCNYRFCVTIFVSLVQSFLVVVIGCTRKMRNFQKDIRLECLP